jgi:hypothetical protein
MQHGFVRLRRAWLVLERDVTVRRSALVYFACRCAGGTQREQQGKAGERDRHRASFLQGL